MPRSPWVQAPDADGAGSPVPSACLCHQAARAYPSCPRAPKPSISFPSPTRWKTIAVQVACLPVGDAAPRTEVSTLIRTVQGNQDSLGDEGVKAVTSGKPVAVRQRLPCSARRPSCRGRRANGITPHAQPYRQHSGESARTRRAACGRLDDVPRGIRPPVPRRSHLSGVGSTADRSSTAQ